MGLMMKKFNILWFHWKIQLLGGGGHGEVCLKRGLGRFADLRWVAWKERGGGDFKGGWYPTAHYESEIVFKLSPIVLLKLMLFISVKFFDFVWYLCWVSFKLQVNNKYHYVY